MKKIIIGWVLAVLLVAGAATAATLPTDVLSDYKPLKGYIVKQLGDEYLIDLDAEDGLRRGDILTVITPGEELVHPVTQQIIGSLDSVKVFLRVEQIRAGFSHVLPLGEVSALAPGEPVVRFTQVPAAIVDDGAAPESLAAELRKALPHLDWTAAETPMLSFQIAQDRLKVLGADGTLLRSYELDVAKAASVAPVVKPTQPVSPIIRQQDLSQEGIWYGPNLKGAAIALVSGNFDGDENQELAVLLSGRLEVGRVEQGAYKEIASFEMTGGKPVALESIDLNGDGRDEIFLVTENGKDVLARELALVDNQVVVEAEVPWHVRKVTLPGEGELLLGQEADEVQLFSGKVFRVKREQGHLRKGDILPLPEPVNIYGFTPFVDERGELNYAFLSDTDYLKVANAAGETLWESEDYYGGSEVRVTRKDSARDEELLTFIRPRLLVNREGEILVSWNDGIRLMSRYRAYNESQLVALSWNGFVMNETWRTVVQKGYLADFALADVDHDGKDELATLVKFKRKGLLSGARSGVVVYELLGEATP
mgnify:CR=1 FL=1